MANEDRSIKSEPLGNLLRELALDLGVTWNRHSDSLWRQIDTEVWMLTRNPWLMLQLTTDKQLEAMNADQSLRNWVEALVLERRKLLHSHGWFQKSCQNSSLKQVAYFSMEFGLSEALPIYSGGLGNVAGDQLKAGSDLGVPIVGVGLLYQQGYFRQAIDQNGYQRDLFPYNPPTWLPITPVRDANGELLRVELFRDLMALGSPRRSALGSLAGGRKPTARRPAKSSDGATPSRSIGAKSTLARLRSRPSVTSITSAHRSTWASFRLTLFRSSCMRKPRTAEAGSVRP